MRRVLALSLLMLLSVAGAFALDGAAPFGRLALSLGLPSLAAPLLEDPLWKGVALYRQGRFNEAVAALREAGPPGLYDRGNALAFAGRFGEAVEVYDAHIYRLPYDEDARVNRALVAGMIEIVGEANAVENGMSDVLTAGEQTVEEVKKGLTLEEAFARWQENVGREHDGQSIVASRQWLATLTDEPGRYIKLRIAAEHKRRIDGGTAMAPGSSPW